MPREASRILGTARSHRGRPATDSECDQGAITAANSGPARDTHDLLGDHLPLSEPDWDEFLQRRSSWDLAMACQPVAPDAHRRSKGLPALPHRDSTHPLQHLPPVEGMLRRPLLPARPRDLSATTRSPAQPHEVSGP